MLGLVLDFGGGRMREEVAPQKLQVGIGEWGVGGAESEGSL